ncbi:uncharacterized protein LOC118601575 isoform X2 [Rousettus aegyptiacus]|uniref:uncharacterized protein LOC118601575 isoform X2 n=1 Tax=Rousettus aegyptiacus TaxID=9407 RepID=UPI00168D01D1|nr:uncharacterized protein LOC118601575 isoform X2 [Rousettus aegyptiacus]
MSWSCGRKAAQLLTLPAPHPPSSYPGGWRKATDGPSRRKRSLRPHPGRLWERITILSPCVHTAPGKARAGSAVLVTKSRCLRPSKSDQTATGATQPRLARAAAPEPPSQQEPEVGRVPDVAGPDAYRRHSRGDRWKYRVLQDRRHRRCGGQSRASVGTRPPRGQGTAGPTSACACPSASRHAESEARETLPAVGV